MYECVHVAVHSQGYSHVTINFPELHASRDSDNAVASLKVSLLGIKRHCGDKRSLTRFTETNCILWAGVR